MADQRPIEGEHPWGNPPEPHHEPETLGDRAADAGIEAAKKVLGREDRARIFIVVEQIEDAPGGEPDSASAANHGDAWQMLQDLLCAARNVGSQLWLDVDIVTADRKGQG